MLIDVKGDKVDPVEVEDVLAVHPEGRRGRRRRGRERASRARTSSRPWSFRTGACEERELIRFARERLSDYKTPQMVEFREEIPKSPSGKVLRKYLLD